LVEGRKELEGLGGVGMEDLEAERLAEHYEVLAHHFSRAEQWERALDYLLKAAEKAAKAFGLRQALDLYGQALEVAARLGDAVPAATLMTIHRARADIYHWVGEFSRSRETAEALVHLARLARDRQAEAAGLVQLASALQWLEDFPTALGRAGEAIELAQATDAPRALGRGLYVRGFLHAVSARLDPAAADLERAMAIAERVGDVAV